MQTAIQSENVHTKSSKILVFDEDVAVRAMIVQGLKDSKNARVYEAGSWGALEEKIRTQLFDVIVFGQFPSAKIDPSSLESYLQRGQKSSSVDQELELCAAVLSKLSGSCERLVLLYDNDQITPTESKILSRDRWISLARISAQQLHLESLEKYQFYPRPVRSQLIDMLIDLGRLASESRPSEQQMTSTEHTIAEQNLVLWAGPDDHPLVKELEKACVSIHHYLVSVDSAQYALRETRRTRFEACFVHNDLSDMAGLSLVRSLRREVGESLPVAYVGVAQEVGDRLEGVHAGVSLYINETAGFDAVTQAIRHLQNLGTHGVSRVLVIDDEDSVISNAISEELKRGKFQISCLTSPLRILELLAEIQTDLLMINAEMKGLGGFELCRTLRAMPEWQTLPIMLVGENYTDELKIAAYRSGADDYLSTSSEGGMVRSCVEGRLERSRTVQERADRDGLTGLLIRRAFNDALLSQMALARRRSSTVAVCLIDLDHFKSINDTYGHIAGDRVLSALGRLLSSSFRVEDLRGRWGGEEFVVAFSDETAESARFILDRARREFIQFYFDGEHGERFQSTFSAGIACYPEAGETIEDVFKVADRRLYAVKEAGRNNIFAHDLDETESEVEVKIESITPSNVALVKDQVDSRIDAVVTVVTPAFDHMNNSPVSSPKKGLLEAQITTADTMSKVDDRRAETDEFYSAEPLPQFLPPFSDED